MSATNSTVNYGLPQFLATDKPAWLTDFNGAMSDIDTAIKEAKTAGDNAQSTANTNTANIQTLDGTVTSQGTAIGSLQTAVAGNTGAINTINSLIGNGEPTTTDKTIIGAINEINSKVGDVEADDVSFDNANTGLSATDVQAAIVEVKGLIPSGGAVDADDVGYDNTTSGLTATDVQAAIDEVQAEVATISVADLNLGASTACTVTPESGLSIDTGTDVKVSLNTDKSIGKVYGGIMLTGTLAWTTSTPIKIATLTNVNLPLPDADYDIYLGLQPIYRSVGTKWDFMPAKLTFKTNGSIEVYHVPNRTETSTNGSFVINLPACLYILKDLGD